MTANLPIRGPEPTLGLIRMLRDEEHLSRETMQRALNYRRKVLAQSDEPNDERPGWQHLQILTAQLANKPLDDGYIKEEHAVTTTLQLGFSPQRRLELEHPLLVQLEPTRGASIGWLTKESDELAVLTEGGGLDDARGGALYVDAETFHREAEALRRVSVPVGLQLNGADDAALEALRKALSTRRVEFVVLRAGDESIAALNRVYECLGEQSDPHALQAPILVEGGLRNPSDMLKALALGARGIIVSAEVVKVIEKVRCAEECPRTRVGNFIHNCVELMKVLARACGHAKLADFTRKDLSTWHYPAAMASGVEYSGVGHDSARKDGDQQ